MGVSVPHSPACASQLLVLTSSVILVVRKPRDEMAQNQGDVFVLGLNHRGVWAALPEPSLRTSLSSIQKPLRSGIYWIPSSPDTGRQAQPREARVTVLAPGSCCHTGIRSN